MGSGGGCVVGMGSRGGRGVETAALGVSESLNCQVEALAKGIDGVALTSKVVESTLGGGKGRERVANAF